jgi:hypothetical protein
MVDPEKSANEAFDEGREAANRGAHKNENPYPLDSELHEAWSQGFDVVLADAGSATETEEY